MGVTVKFFTLVVLSPQVPSSHQHLQYTPPILALGQQTLHILCVEKDIYVPPPSSICVDSDLRGLCLGVVFACRYVSKTHRRSLIDKVDMRTPGHDQTLLQTLILPVFVIPTLLPTPLLEPRYFLIPYILMRSQVTFIPQWGLVIEGLWYGVVNGVTMSVFLYRARDGVGRFMW